MKLLLKYLAYILIISSFFRIIPVIAALIYGEPYANFIFTFAISFFLGVFLLMLERKINEKDTTMTLRRGLMLVAISFILLPSISMITFLPSFNYNPLDAFFESISGFTTTGLTLYTSLDGLPRSLLLWRAETQWIGGIGIIMVFLFIFSRLKPHTYGNDLSESAQDESTLRLYQAQGFSEKLEPSLKKTTADILLIYLFYTAAGILLLMATGMPLFDSVAMSFTSLSTGGFSVSDSFYSGTPQLLVLCLLMVVGSISFITHNKLLLRRFREFFMQAEKNILLAMIAVAVLIGFMAFRDFKSVFFMMASAFTTTGYSIADVGALPQLVAMLIMLGMVIGGCAASTSGGVKVFRIYFLVESIRWLIKKLSSPAGAIIPFKVQGRPMDEDNLLTIHIFFFSYILILFIGTAVFMFLGFTFFDASFQVTSALGTVGLQSMSLSALPWLGKAVLIVAMLLGRLEIFPLLVLLKIFFER